MDRFWDNLGSAYQTGIVDAGKEAQLVVLVSFLLTFATVRIITHAIRAGRWQRVFHNLSIGGAHGGGTHLHHLVPGIFLLLISGYFGIAVVPSDDRSIWAVLFGIGAALTLDEFALWLHLADVYWAKQGRASIDAVVIAATLVGLGILGWGFWLDLAAMFGNFVRLIWPF